MTLLDFLIKAGKGVNGAPDKKPEQNELCWCGSGKKYERCHLESDQRKASANFTVCKEPAQELNLEVLRLLVQSPYAEQALRDFGSPQDETAAWLREALPRPGGVLMTADDGRRLQGLLYMEPMPDPSTAMGIHVWNLGILIIAPGVSGDAVAAMLEKSIAALDLPVDYIIARVPPYDGITIRGLQKSGFEVISGEAISVVNSPGPLWIQQEVVDFVHLGPKHLDAALEIACDCTQCSSLACNQGFDRNQVCKLADLNLRSHIHERNKQGMLALNFDGEALGFATYSFDADIWVPPTYGVGSMDQLCMSTDNLKLERLLIRRVLNELYKGGAETVITKTLLTDRSAIDESLKKTGFEVTQSNLVMHRWLPARPAQVVGQR